MAKKMPIKRSTMAIPENDVPKAKKTKTKKSVISSSSLLPSPTTQPLNPPAVPPLHPSIVANQTTAQVNAMQKENVKQLKNDTKKNVGLESDDKLNPSCTLSSTTTEDKVIVFDLETTGLIYGTDMPDICQIAAQVIGEEELWSRYLMPCRSINSGASKVTGLKIEKNIKDSQVITKNGEAIEAVEYEAGVRMFYEYLHGKSLQLIGSNGRIILVAHNGKYFDFPVLINAFKKIHITQTDLEKINITFADSLLILRKAAKENPQSFTYQYNEGEVTKKKKFSFSLVNLHHHFCHDSFPAHDACEDVKALIRVLQSALVSPEATIARNTFTI